MNEPKKIGMAMSMALRRLIEVTSALGDCYGAAAVFSGLRRATAQARISLALLYQGSSIYLYIWPLFSLQQRYGLVSIP